MLYNIVRQKHIMDATVLSIEGYIKRACAFIKRDNNLEL